MIGEREKNIVFGAIHFIMGITRAQLCSKSRLEQIVKGKKVLYKLLKNELKLSYHVISKFTKSNHSTVIFHVADKDPEVLKLYDKVLKECKKLGLGK